MKAFCLYDKKSGEYSCLSLYPNFAMFRRSLLPEVRSTNPHNILAGCPEDFDIYQVGEFDPQTAVFTSDIKFMCNCLDLKEV